MENNHYIIIKLMKDAFSQNVAAIKSLSQNQPS